MESAYCIFTDIGMAWIRNEWDLLGEQGVTTFIALDAAENPQTESEAALPPTKGWDQLWSLRGIEYMNTACRRVRPNTHRLLSATLVLLRITFSLKTRINKRGNDSTSRLRSKSRRGGRGRSKSGHLQYLVLYGTAQPISRRGFNKL